MNELLLIRFIANHPDHFLNKYFQILINSSDDNIDMTEAEIIQELYNIATRNNKLSTAEVEACNILLTNIIGHG